MDTELTMNQAVQLIGCTDFYVRQAIKAGALKAHLRFGSKRLGWRIARTDLAAWLESLGDIGLASRVLAGEITPAAHE